MTLPPSPGWGQQHDQSELILRVAVQPASVQQGRRKGRQHHFRRDRSCLGQARSRRATRLRRILDPSARRPCRPESAHRRVRVRRCEARALLQAGQGNARALKSQGSHRGIASAGTTVAVAKERTWRNGRRWGLKILFPIGSAGSNPAVRTIAAAGSPRDCRGSDPSAARPRLEMHSESLTSG